ncbi:hypothetical protein DEH18_17205 [Streptomyces sp. NHF165]|uniref:hypothetical protein n=1 Tax=unclassified Streptomyces TaxID=2593676 RepID=UPI0004C85DBE|nr:MULTISPECIES: hypothetical protein [unclassified Streptomyces]QHF95313.1 hypothetical protein DEH18_17205 [Streptomyces sp. NHF165]
MAEHDTIRFTKRTLEEYRDNELRRLEDAAQAAELDLSGYQGADALKAGADTYQPALHLQNNIKLAGDALTQELKVAYALFRKMGLMMSATSAVMSAVEDDNAQLTNQQLQAVLGPAFAAADAAGLDSAQSGGGGGGGGVTNGTGGTSNPDSTQSTADKDTTTGPGTTDA